MDGTQELFSCQRCGYCCHGETTVSLGENDLVRMLKVLNLDEEETFQKYLRRTNSVVQMKTIDGHCVFYEEGCHIHAGRPWRCTQWPLHPSILKDENNLKTIKASCPGINRELSYEEFCQKLRPLLSIQDTVPK